LRGGREEEEKGREGKGREGKGREGKGREGKGREGRGGGRGEVERTYRNFTLRHEIPFDKNAQGTREQRKFGRILDVRLEVGRGADFRGEAVFEGSGEGEDVDRHSVFLVVGGDGGLGG
jgi:hypothetical protein